MPEEREEAGGGPHFSLWHLEPSGQRAAPAGVGAAGSFPTPGRWGRASRGACPPDSDPAPGWGRLFPRALA